MRSLLLLLFAQISLVQPTSANPFAGFVGEWTLKDDLWEQSDGRHPPEQIRIAGHHTRCTTINTDNSLLWVVDATFPRGHILWVQNRATGDVSWLSSFEPTRSGVGRGEMDAKANLEFQVTFEGEPAGTYRKYSYTWNGPDEFGLRSVQYDQNDQPTGAFYGGTFVRIRTVARSAEGLQP